MRPTNLPRKSNLAHPDTITRMIQVHSRSLFLRLGAILIFAALLITVFNSASSASFPGKLEKKDSPVVSRDKVPAAGAFVKTAERVSPSLRDSFNPLLLPLPQSSGESIATYASDCTTSKTEFVVGETVCVKVSGIPLSSFFPRRLTWATTDSTIVRATDITEDPQTDSLLITATTELNGLTIDNRGIWQVAVRNPFFGFLEAIARFTVTDPANASADLGVASTFASGSVQAGSQTSFGLQVNNYGPNIAANVQLHNAVSAGADLVSSVQLTGPEFICDGAVCSIASLAAGDEATFVVTYEVNSGTEVINTASISSSTSDPNSLNNSISAITTVTADTGSACTLTCPESIVASNDPGTGGYVIPSANFPQPTTSGTCGSVSLTVSPNPQTNQYFFPIGTSFVTASTETGEACTFTVTVNDVENPTISCPADITTFESPAGSGSSAVNYTVTANDNSGSATVDCGDHPSGSSFPVGTTQVTCIATDAADNSSSSCSFNITVNEVDSTCVLTTQAPIVVDSAANACGTTVTYTTPSSDGSGTCGTVTCDRPSGSFFAVGETLVTCTSNPDGGSTSFTVTVNDTTAPVPDLSSLPTITSDCTANAGIPTVIQTPTGPKTVYEPPTATDNCGGTIQGGTNDPRVYQDPGTFIVHWVYTDASGNTSSQDQTIEVTGSDVTAPVPDVATLPTVTAECSATVDSPPTASDDCDGTLTGTTPDPLTYTGVGTYTVHWTYTDQVGHSVTQNQTVVVTDETDPTITLVGASSITVECHTSFSDPGVTTTDDCVPKNVTVATTGSVNVNVPNTYTLTYTATDGGGNQASVQRTVIVQDTIAPTIISVPAPTTDAASCAVTIPNVAAGTVTSDSCGTVTVTQNPLAGAPAVLGSNTITVTATDASGNSSQTTTSFTVNSLQFIGSVWLGLKNSDDVGTKFDLRAEIRKNGELVGSGETYDLSGGSSGFNNAILRTVNVALSSTGFCGGDNFSITLLVRVAASSGHVSGTARLWYNDSAANSRFTTTANGVPSTYFLRKIGPNLVLDGSTGPLPKLTIDVLVNRNQNGNPFKPFGTWNKTF